MSQTASVDWIICRDCCGAWPAGSPESACECANVNEHTFRVTPQPEAHRIIAALLAETTPRAHPRQDDPSVMDGDCVWCDGYRFIARSES